jgi:hypothetical protein
LGAGFVVFKGVSLPLEFIQLIPLSTYFPVLGSSVPGVRIRNHVLGATGICVGGFFEPKLIMIIFAVKYVGFVPVLAFLHLPIAPHQPIGHLMSSVLLASRKRECTMVCMKFGNL